VLTGILKFFKMDYLDIVKVSECGGHCMCEVGFLDHFQFVPIYNSHVPPPLHSDQLDCEGCEIAFTRDILAEDPSFLSKVGQISIETHVTKAWINTTEQLYYFSLLFPLVNLVVNCLFVNFYGRSVQMPSSFGSCNLH
jgi:hypothetical protein